MGTWSVHSQHLHSSSGTTMCLFAHPPPGPRRKTFWVSKMGPALPCFGSWRTRGVKDVFDFLAQTMRQGKAQLSQRSFSRARDGRRLKMTS